MDDLDELQSRVAAAQEKMRLSADDQRKYGLRLNDVVAIVEGSLARQQDEMRQLQAAAVELRLERDTARQAEAELKSAYEAALPKLAKREAQNEQLRAMVLTLLNVIEGRESPLALQGMMQRLEDSLTQLTTASAIDAEVGKEPDAPFSALIRDTANSQRTNELASLAETAAVATSFETSAAATPDTVDEVASLEVEPAEQLADEALNAAPEAEAGQVIEDMPAATESIMVAEHAAEIEALEDDFDDADLSVDQPENIEQISMTEHENLVSDPELANASAPQTINGNGSAEATQQEEPLMSALLDAEKALIEAGANGFTNGNSPVADIIRRISLRTREFSEASGS